MKWSQKELDYIKRVGYYISRKEIAKKLNRTLRSVEHKCAEIKINKVRKLNTKFFKNWSYDMAYITGFTLADGCVLEKEKRLSYGVQSSDLNILKYICDCLEYPQKYIHIRKQYNKQRNKTYECARLKICSQEIFYDLGNLGIIPRKTGFEIIPPDMPDKFKFSFLLGLFDGDGCINISDKSSNQLTFTIYSASKVFLENIKNNIGYSFGYIYVKDSIFVWKIFKQSHIQDIYNNLYLHNNFYLHRKRNIFKLRFN